MRVLKGNHFEIKGNLKSNNEENSVLGICSDSRAVLQNLRKYKFFEGYLVSTVFKSLSDVFGS